MPDKGKSKSNTTKGKSGAASKPKADNKTAKPTKSTKKK